jgi:hypothetical protein
MLMSVVYCITFDLYVKSINEILLDYLKRSEQASEFFLCADKE